jgi:hypothetical protein
VAGVGAATVCGALLFLAACTGGSVPLPPQRRSYAGPEPREFGAFARVADPRDIGHLVRGLRPSGRWAWTDRRAALRFLVDDPRPQKFTADLFIAVRTFEQTGPIDISWRIDGRLLGALRCDAPRQFVFEKPVPEGWIERGRPIEVELEADKASVAPDGVEYGFLLVSAGFVPR